MEPRPYGRGNPVVDHDGLELPTQAAMEPRPYGRGNAVVGFWSNPHAQEVLRGQLFSFLDDYEIVDFDNADAVAGRLMELAKANQHRLVAS